MKASLSILSLILLVLTPGWASNPSKAYKGPVAKYKTINPSQLKIPKSAQWGKKGALWDPKNQQKLRNYWAQQGQRRQQFYNNSRALTQRLNKMKFSMPKRNTPRLPKPKPNFNPKPNPMMPTQQQMFDNSMKYIQQGMQKQQQNTPRYAPPTPTKVAVEPLRAAGENMLLLVRIVTTLEHQAVIYLRPFLHQGFRKLPLRLFSLTLIWLLLRV